MDQQNEEWDFLEDVNDDDPPTETVANDWDLEADSIEEASRTNPGDEHGSRNKVRDRHGSADRGPRKRAGEVS